MYNEGFNCHLMDFISLKYVFSRNVAVMFSGFKINADLSETCLVPSVYKMCCTIDLCYLGRRDCTNIFLGFIWYWTLKFCGSLGILWLAQRLRAQVLCTVGLDKIHLQRVMSEVLIGWYVKTYRRPTKTYYVALKFTWQGWSVTDRSRFLTNDEVLESCLFCLHWNIIIIMFILVLFWCTFTNDNVHRAM
jgi:hypothetical protein